MSALAASASASAAELDSTVSPLSILSALTQSRQTLLFSTLPLFSTKSRSKTAPQLSHPAHSINQLSTTNISIGPHSFPKTKLFLLEWTPATPPPPPTLVPPKPSPSSTQTPAQQSAAASAANAITPALIMRLNAASAADPALASVLRKAAAGQANNTELSSLARYIESMRRDDDAIMPPITISANPPPLPPAPTPPTPAPVASTSTSAPTPQPQPQPPAQPIRPPSLVIEFRESSTERFILPSHFTCTVLPPSSSANTAVLTNANRRNLLLSFFVFPADKSSSTSDSTLIGGTPSSGKENTGKGTIGGGGGSQAPTWFPPGTKEVHKGKPVPISLILEDVTEATKNGVWKCSRSSRESEKKDHKNEDWWKKMISEVLPRLFVLPTTLPVPLLPLPTLEPSASSFALSRTTSLDKLPTPSTSAGKRRARNSGTGSARKKNIKSVSGEEGSREGTPVVATPKGRGKKSGAPRKPTPKKSPSLPPASPGINLPVAPSATATSSSSSSSSPVPAPSSSDPASSPITLPPITKRKPGRPWKNSNLGTEPVINAEDVEMGDAEGSASGEKVGGGEQVNEVKEVAVKEGEGGAVGS